MIWIINYTLIECEPLILNVAEYFLIKRESGLLRHAKGLGFVQARRAIR